MIKLFFYTILFGMGGYALVTRLPDSYKEKMLAAIGLGEINGRSFILSNPAAKREDLLAKLEENLVKVEEFQKAGSSGSDTSITSITNPKDPEKSILIEGRPILPAPPPKMVGEPGQLAPLIQEQKEIIEQLKDLNPKTGLLPKALEKILGLDSPPPAAFDQITPSQKAEICK